MQCIWHSEKKQKREAYILQSPPSKRPLFLAPEKLLHKKYFIKELFGAINFVKSTKQSLYKANTFACSLANRAKPVAAAVQRKCSGGILFVIITKIITKRDAPKNYFVIIMVRMVMLHRKLHLHFSRTFHGMFFLSV